MQRRTTITTLFLSLVLLFGGYHLVGQDGLKAEFYDGTNFNRLVQTKYVPNIDMSWNRTPPVPGINPQECSIRWTGKLRPGRSGTYTFSAQVDDGIRVWIDGRLIIDQWGLNDMGIFEGSLTLTGDQSYDLKVEYFNAMIEGEVRLMWKFEKETLSWYERVFGDGIDPMVIAPGFLFPPEEPIEPPKKEAVVNAKKVEREVTKDKPVIKTKPKKKKKSEPVKFNKVVKPQPVKPEVAPEEVQRYLPQNVQFEKGKTTILDASYPELNAFIDFLSKHPQLNVAIEGHTDVVGDAELNLQLSKERAKVIASYLMQKGINEERISHEGFGGTKPLVVPPKGQYHPANRRVVFKVNGY